MKRCHRSRPALALFRWSQVLRVFQPRIFDIKLNCSFYGFFKSSPYSTSVQKVHSLSKEHG